jgi:hypothetical protein
MDKTGLVRLTLCAGLFIASTAHSAELCGVTIRPKLQLIRSQVEQFYGRPIDCQEVSKTGEDDESGHSDVVGGTPTIRIKREDSPVVAEEVLAHELLHLQLYTQGFLGPSAGEFRQGFPLPVDGRRAGEAVVQLESYYQHRLFPPKLKALGIDPRPHQRLLVETWIGQVSAKLAASGGQVRLAPELASIYYIDVKCQDEEDAVKLRQFYEDQGWTRVLELSKKLEILTNGRNPTNTEASERTVRECLRLIYDTPDEYYKWPIPSKMLEP